MTYNEWRDELKSNLLSVPESERRRVLDYYAEAYADRRDAGFSEREIIEDFGAPYDAAQRILSENAYEDYAEPTRYYNEPKEEREPKKERREREREEREREREARRSGRDEFFEAPPEPQKAEKTRGDYTWAFVLLCVLFAIPISVVVICMVSFTISLCVAPFATLISGIASVIAGIAGLFTSVTNGVLAIGTGLIVFGVSLILFPVCFKLVKWMWKLFGMFFGWLRKLFSGKSASK